MYPDGAYQAAYKKAGGKDKRFVEVHEIHNVFAAASRVRRNGAVRVYNDEVGFVYRRVYHALAHVEQSELSLFEQKGNLVVDYCKKGVYSIYCTYRKKGENL